MKHNKLLRWIGMICSLLIFASAALPTAALTPSYTITGTYLSSTYYDNLRHLPRTGDKAFDTLAIALSQLDYHEGNSTADFNGENRGGYRNYTEYNHAFGQIGGTYGYAWCAAFVSWCLEEADAADSAGGLYASCTLWVEALRALGQYSTRASGYTPQTGDLIFFKSAGVSRASDHVGLVRYVKNGRVYTVEGNSSDRVSLRDYALKDSYIVGYGRPRYLSDYRLPHTALECEDAVAGWYTVTNDFLNVRATASASGKKLGALDKGDMIRIVSVKNGWGSFYYNEQLAFVSLDYADFTAPLSHTVRYDAAGGEGAPSAQSHYSMEEVFASSAVPKREGYRFLCWQDAQGKRYESGERLPTGDRTLSAVWEAIPVTLPSDEALPTLPEQDVGQAEQEDFLSPVPGDNATFLPQQEAMPRDYRAPRIAAGVVVATGSAAVLGYWVYLRRRED